MVGFLGRKMRVIEEERENKIVRIKENNLFAFDYIFTLGHTLKLGVASLI